MRRAFAVLGALALVACGGTHSAVQDRVLRIVDGPPATYSRIVVSGAARSAEVTGALRTDATPLLAARTFSVPQPLADYGLDYPRATVTYLRAGAPVAVVTFGSTDFDNHGVYARRSGDPRVFLVLVDVAGPLLSLVGITLPPPTD